MGYSISVLIFFIDPREVPERLSSYLDAADLIGDRLNGLKQEENTGGFVQSTSRNWWHQHLLYLMCKEYDIQGLEFAAQEIALLSTQELSVAEAGMDELFGRFDAHRLPEKLDMFEAYADILGPQFFTAFETAQAVADVDQYDIGFEASISFCAFLKSLRHMIQLALQQNRLLLFVMPSFNELNGSFEA